MASSDLNRRQKIHKRIRKKVQGTADRPRLAVYRSNKQIYAQLIDDIHHVTIVSSNSIDASKNNKNTKIELAIEVGKSLAKLALQKGISTVSFDRGGYLYHGRIKALADGARGYNSESGKNDLLQF